MRLRAIRPAYSEARHAYAQFMSKLCWTRRPTKSLASNRSCQQATLTRPLGISLKFLTFRTAQPLAAVTTRIPCGFQGRKLGFARACEAPDEVHRLWLMRISFPICSSDRMRETVRYPRSLIGPKIMTSGPARLNR